MILLKKFKLQDSGLQKGLFSVLLVVFGIALYRQAIHIELFGDNLQLLLPDVSANPLIYLFKTVPTVRSFRPVETVFMAWSQSVFGPLNAVPINSIRILFHILPALLVGYVSLKLTGSTVGSAMASIMFLCSQAAVMAVCDNFSHIFSVFSGCLGLWLFYSVEIGKGINTGGRWKTGFTYGFTLVLCATAVWTKESGIVFPFLIILLHLAVGEKNRAVKGVGIIGIAPFLFIAVVYLLFHSILDIRQVSFGEGPYQFSFGKNIFLNTAMLCGAAGCCWSSVDCFLGAESGAWMRLLLIANVSILFWSIPVWGVVIGKQRKLHALLLIMAMISILPFLFLNHVSELYVYSILPFLYITAGSGIGTIWNRCAEKKGIRVVLLILVFIWIGFQSRIATRKCRMVFNNSRYAAAVIRQLEPLVRNAQQRSSICLHEPVVNERRYSIFILPGFSALYYGVPGLLGYWKRPDVSLRIIRSGKHHGRLQSENTLHLSATSGNNPQLVPVDIKK